MVWAQLQQQQTKPKPIETAISQHHEQNPKDKSVINIYYIVSSSITSTTTAVSAVFTAADHHHNDDAAAAAVSCHR